MPRLGTEQRYERQRRATEAWKVRDPEGYAASRLRAKQTDRKRHPEAERAKKRVYRATSEGTLIRPRTCQQCNREGPVHAHHWHGYEDALDVEWLCQSCHTQAHRLLYSQESDRQLRALHPRSTVRATQF